MKKSIGTAMTLGLLIVVLHTLTANRNSDLRQGGEAEAKCCDGKPFYTSSIQSAAFNGDHNAWLTDIEGNIWRTTDGGASWNKGSRETVGEIQQITFIDSLNGWAINKIGDVLRTENGGQS